jgi:hypothetical protein
LGSLKYITSATVANQVKGLLDSFGLLDKVFAYFKDKRSHLNILNFNVENFGDDMICFLNDPISRNIVILKCYFHLLWTTTSYSFIF